MKIAKRVVAETICPPGKRFEDFRIEGCQNLWVRTFQSNDRVTRRTWMTVYKVTIEGRQVRRAVTLGDASLATFLDIKPEWDRLQNGARAGRDVIGEEGSAVRAAAVAGITLDALYCEWMDRKGKLKPSWQTDDSRYNVHLKGSFGARAFKDITRKEWESQFDSMVKPDADGKHRGHGANRCKSLLSRLYNYAVSRDYVAANLLAGVPKPMREVASDRYLSDAELSRFWHEVGMAKRVRVSKKAGAVPSTTPQAPAMLRPMQLLLRLELMTCVRRKELSGARKSELHLDDAVPYWRVPAERMKGKLGDKLPHVAWLGPLAVKLFREALTLAEGSPFVFPSPEDRKKPIRPDAVTRATGRYMLRLQRQAREEGTDLFVDWAHLHDLRRTISMPLAHAGVSREARGWLLAHRDGSITAKNYTPGDEFLHKEGKRAAMLILERHIRRVCGLDEMARPAPLRARLRVRQWVKV